MRELHDSESTLRVTLHFFRKMKNEFLSIFHFPFFFHKKLKIKKKLNSFFIFQFSTKNGI